jgi:hypothetical protein
MTLTKPLKIALGVAVAVLALCGLGVALTGGNEPTSAAPPAATTAGSASAPTLTTAQRNAARSAENYLSAMPFSRPGLIKQLAFEGYSVADATLAVDSITVDWMVQAERAAANYTGTMPFSRAGLIKQLKFDGYTATQAAHGADSVGL